MTELTKELLLKRELVRAMQAGTSVSTFLMCELPRGDGDDCGEVADYGIAKGHLNRWYYDTDDTLGSRTRAWAVTSAGVTLIELCVEHDDCLVDEKLGRACRQKEGARNGER